MSDIKIFSVDSKHTDLVADLMPADFSGLGPNSLVLASADEENYVTGVLWAEFYLSTCEIKHIAVHPDVRRQGVATRLIDAFLETFYGIGKITPVFLLFADTDSTFAFKRLLQSTGRFEFRESSQLFRYHAETRKTSEKYRAMKEKNTPGAATKFFEESKGVRTDLIQELMKKGVYYPDDLLSDGENYVKDLCFCCKKDDTITALILISDDFGVLTVSYLYLDDAVKKGLVDVLSTTMTEADRLYPDMDIEAIPLTQSVKRLLDMTFGEEGTTIPILRADWNFG